MGGVIGIILEGICKKFHENANLMVALCEKSRVINKVFGVHHMGIMNVGIKKKNPLNFQLHPVKVQYVLKPNICSNYQPNVKKQHL